MSKYFSPMSWGFLWGPHSPDMRFRFFTCFENFLQCFWLVGYLVLLHEIKAAYLALNQIYWIFPRCKSLWNNYTIFLKFTPYIVEQIKIRQFPKPTVSKQQSFAGNYIVSKRMVQCCNQFEAKMINEAVSIFCHCMNICFPYYFKWQFYLPKSRSLEYRLILTSYVNTKYQEKNTKKKIESLV